MAEKPELGFYLDIGTNGEMILGNNTSNRMSITNPQPPHSSNIRPTALLRVKDALKR